MIYTGNTTHKNRRKRGEKEHPVGLPRDVQYYWRAEILLLAFPYLNMQNHNTALSNIETFLFIGSISVKAPYGNIICGTV